MIGAGAVVIGDADGTAEFLSCTAARMLQYHESGRLRLALEQRVVSFSRRFSYEIADDILDVAFADGMQAGQAYQRYRYDPDQGALLPLAAHVCLLDRYDACYQLHGDDRFDLKTRIEGPHKDYVLHTQFARLAG